ncbi:glutamate--cysteine ligase [Actinopolymorpha cephalotaxi]|uniref:Glutamate--cysteine ligase EgtA n=1 Tax=Actinopolymorpha cephalotaxi TaxID=504797 RepID=A0A1I2VJG0_9ACTN|nr:glutamate-cysteine ligase family protein [Actinopolymorpha cephalotaxi]NYH83299.1 glutamate--cysteine ligase [Actinopolymorpha cephalotaxi]SFG89418.1 glutamate--cysteine ligase [Actinopolymorpha cephalotaxi]
MTDTAEVVSCDSVHGHIGRICFKTGPPTTVGTEIEWLVVSPDHPRELVPLDLLRTTLDQAGPPPGGSTVTFEPGGQVELSSAPAPGVTACWSSLQADIDHLRAALATLDLRLLWTAIDPFREPRRQLSHPRYDAMEAYFDRRGPEGRLMMCSTASVQVNLDAGTDAADIARRWRILHAIGPALVAAFANSPRFAGRQTGWKSARQAVWQRLDPRRTRSPHGPDPVAAWADYALDAPLMMRRDGDGWRSDPGLTFRQWLHPDDGHARHDGHAGSNGHVGNGRVDGIANGHVAHGTDGSPTTQDLDYHLTTLFPPVRPRGWFEIRYLDVVPAAYWPVPMAVLTALVDDPRAGERALAATEPVVEAWWNAARDGLDHRGLAHAARCCFEVALEVLHRQGAERAVVNLVDDYRLRYVDRGRCPADDGTDPLTSDSDREESR